MSKITSIVAGAAVLPILAFAAPVNAVELPTGQFEGGNIYRAVNFTKNANPAGDAFVDPANATCGDTVLFRVRIHNVGAYAAETVKVQATLPTAAATSHSSKVTLSSPNSNTVTDTAGVTLDKAGKLSYVAGSTELLDANQSKLGNIADGIIGAGVTLNDKVGVSTQQKVSVQFKAKVNCDTPPVTPPTTPPTVEKPVELVKTGAGEVAAVFAAAAAFGALAYNIVLRRRNAS